MGKKKLGLVLGGLGVLAVGVAGAYPAAAESPVSGQVDWNQACTKQFGPQCQDAEPGSTVDRAYLLGDGKNGTVCGNATTYYWWLTPDWDLACDNQFGSPTSPVFVSQGWQQFPIVSCVTA
jgi:hypothetical protein